MAPNRRKSIYSATAKALASLHTADVDAIGLGNYGQRENYCKRQVCDLFCVLPFIRILATQVHLQMAYTK